MELRTLKYFLMVAREESITQAAHLLHITQPALSRQIMQLEEELGAKLFHRSKHTVLLTDDGMLLKRRAQELVALAEKTAQEFSRRNDALSGEIAIGSAETRNMSFLARLLTSFRQEHPLVQYDIHSAIADDIKDRIEKGSLDLGLLTEPVDLGKYAFIRLPQKEQWGILARKDAPLAARACVRPEDLIATPLLLGKRKLVQNEMLNWFGDYREQIEIAATYNLIYNAALLVENHAGVALCFDLGSLYDKLVFLPLSPRLETGAVLVWKKHQAFSPATAAFVQYAKKYLKDIPGDAK